MEQQIDLPDIAVRLIATSLVSDEQKQGLVHLMSMAGVNRQWRSIIGQMESNTTLHFNTLDRCYQLTPLSEKFKRLSPDCKTEFFGVAAQRFSG